MEHNDSIQCTVDECKFHCMDDEYCTLDTIKVIKNKSTASTTESTDCGSFKSKGR